MSSSTQTSTLKTAKAKLTRQLSTLNKLIQEGDHIIIELNQPVLQLPTGLIVQDTFFAPLISGAAQDTTAEKTILKHMSNLLEDITRRLDTIEHLMRQQVMARNNGNESTHAQQAIDGE
ncbi:hypothetical protein Aduo_018854 [Ancylostoma duodenale]